MKKLLILGDNVHSENLIRIAKERGIYTILTDNRAIERSPSKLVADEYWDISIRDTDALYERSKIEGVSGVLCGASEVCTEAVRTLCKRLDLPFWISDKAWEITNDKVKFKELCKKCGLPVAKDYKLDSELKQQDLEKIQYPVVVKPADGCSSVGMHVCNNEAELIEGYRDAYDRSSTKKVVVEKYISGMELGLIYMFHEGKPYFFSDFDFYGDKDNGHPMAFGAEPSISHANFREKYESELSKLVAELDCREGSGFIQVLYNGKEEAVIEMNYRLAGGHFFNGRLLHEHMISCAFSENADIDEKALSHRVQSFIYFIWLKNGVIKHIEGLDKIAQNSAFLAMNPPKKTGEKVVAGTGMQQMLTGILFKAERDKAHEVVDFINETLLVTDEDGNDMVWRYGFELVGSLIQ
ncbi:MAG: ATP-grasp domain-containing protein [Butyrivibrio sp.]|nr:ATP-grasp domain-containing protein [Butyrivibrio sp.]